MVELCLGEKPQELRRVPPIPQALALRQGVLHAAKAGGGRAARAEPRAALACKAVTQVDKVTLQWKIMPGHAKDKSWDGSGRRAPRPIRSSSAIPA